MESRGLVPTSKQRTSSLFCTSGTVYGRSIPDRVSELLLRRENMPLSRSIMTILIAYAFYDRARRFLESGPRFHEPLNHPQLEPLLLKVADAVGYDFV